MTGEEVWDLTVPAFGRSRGLAHPWAMVGHGIGLQLHEGVTLAAEFDRSLQFSDNTAG